MKGGAAVAADSWRVCLCLVVDLLFLPMGPIAGEALCANTNWGLNAGNELSLASTQGHCTPDGAALPRAPEHGRTAAAAAPNRRQRRLIRWQ